MVRTTFILASVSSDGKLGRLAKAGLWYAGRALDGTIGPRPGGGEEGAVAKPGAIGFEGASGAKRGRETEMTGEVEVEAEDEPEPELEAEMTVPEAEVDVGANVEEEADPGVKVEPETGADARAAASREAVLSGGDSCKGERGRGGGEIGVTGETTDEGVSIGVGGKGTCEGVGADADLAMTLGGRGGTGGGPANETRSMGGPVRFAKGSSSNKKSKGGELRGELKLLMLNVLLLFLSWFSVMGIISGVRGTMGGKASTKVSGDSGLEPGIAEPSAP